MGRKKAPISNFDVSEKQSAPLAQKLNALITDPNALKDYLGCTIQAVNQYRLGISRPTLENLCKIADYYNVTTDYLLGRTPTKTIADGIKPAARYTGLSESTLSYIHHSDIIGLTEILDKLFQNEDFQTALNYIVFLGEDYQSYGKVANSCKAALSDDKMNQLLEYEEWIESNFGAHIVHWEQYCEWQVHKILRLLEASIDTIFDLNLYNSESSNQGGARHGEHKKGN